MLLNRSIMWSCFYCLGICFVFLGLETSYCESWFWTHEFIIMMLNHESFYTWNLVHLQVILSMNLNLIVIFWPYYKVANNIAESQKPFQCNKTDAINNQSKADNRSLLSLIIEIHIKIATMRSLTYDVLK